MRFLPLKTEGMQSTYENYVEFNLSERGVLFYSGARRKNMPAINGVAEAGPGTELQSLS
jgi:hypothetical protein